jgi:hypothetical protein
MVFASTRRIGFLLLNSPKTRPRCRRLARLEALDQAVRPDTRRDLLAGWRREHGAKSVR